MYFKTGKILSWQVAVLSVTSPQVQGEALPLPRLPELYLEAGAALLMAHRPADCMALCDEVIISTLELLPEKVLLEEPEEMCEVEPGAAGAEGEERVKVLLWTGAAYLLQGHSHTHLKDWKQAVIHYTRFQICTSCFFESVPFVIVHKWIKFSSAFQVYQSSSEGVL